MSASSNSIEGGGDKKQGDLAYAPRGFSLPAVGGTSGDSPNDASLLASPKANNNKAVNLASGDAVEISGNEGVKSVGTRFVNANNANKNHARTKKLTTSHLLSASHPPPHLPPVGSDGFPSARSHMSYRPQPRVRRVSSGGSGSAGSLSSGSGSKIILSETIIVPVDKYPKYNFVGRILGPRGMTAKQLEDETGCKIMVRGRGSSRMYQGSRMDRTNPDDPLHVQIQVEDYEETAKLKLANAVARIQQLLNPPPEGRDELKRKQLVELSIINGTYRPSAATKVLLRKIGNHPRANMQPDITHLIDPTLNLNPMYFNNIAAYPYDARNDDQMLKMQQLFAAMMMRNPASQPQASFPFNPHHGYDFMF